MRLLDACTDSGHSQYCLQSSSVLLGWVGHVDKMGALCPLCVLRGMVQAVPPVRSSMPYLTQSGASDFRWQCIPTMRVVWLFLEPTLARTDGCGEPRGSRTPSGSQLRISWSHRMHQRFKLKPSRPQGVIRPSIGSESSSLPGRTRAVPRGTVYKCIQVSLRRWLLRRSSLRSASPLGG
jgi:hypothetical protein